IHKRTVFLVIPMFNEELNIEHAIDAAVASLEKYTAEYEMIIVDDASTDTGPSIVSRRAAVNPRIRLIRHTQNRKLGGSLRTGFAAARMELVLYMDADLPFDPDVLNRAVRAMYLTGADVVSGYRLDREIARLLRTNYSYLSTALNCALFG